MKIEPQSERDLNRVADELAEKSYTIIDDFLSGNEVDELLGAFRRHREEENFQKAGIGNAHLYTIDREVRGDYIKWIDPEVAFPAALDFLKKIEDLMQSLNRMLFLSLKDFECHYAIYPPGTFYEKHLDQFKSTNNRKISFAFYLNQNWGEGDGGELRIYTDGGHLDVAPVSGRLALFRSDIVEHEVITTLKDRYSITGWMRDRPVDLPYY